MGGFLFFAFSYIEVPLVTLQCIKSIDMSPYDERQVRFDVDPAELLLSLFPLIRLVVARQLQRKFCELEIDDVCQEVALLLLADNYRRLRAYDPIKCSPPTWLNAIVRNYLNCLRRRRTIRTIAMPDKVHTLSAANNNHFFRERERRSACRGRILS